ncbi:MAG: metallophosphoesterase family protein, partial [Chloroflexota bacterium]
MRIAVLSDIHSNLVALEAVLAKIGAVDAIWHLGDVVGYGAQPDEVVARLSELGATGVRGNHDAAATGATDIAWFNPEARAAMEWTRTTIADTTRAWLAALPQRRTDGDFTLVHGSPRDPTWEYVTSAALARAGLSAIATEH